MPSWLKNQNVTPGAKSAIYDCLVSQGHRVVTTMRSDMWRHRADWTTTGLSLMMLLLWQRVVVAEAGCASDVCFCFEDGDIECADIYLRRVPRFTRCRHVFCLVAYFAPGRNADGEVLFVN